MEDPLNKHPDTGISVLIAGGGIGGLFTALESYRNGHQVTVLEARPSNDPAGLLSKMIVPIGKRSNIH